MVGEGKSLGLSLPSRLGDRGQCIVVAEGKSLGLSSECPRDEGKGEIPGTVLRVP